MIENWLKSLSLQDEEYTFPSKRHEYLKEFPNLYKTKVALLSIDEEKGNSIRKSLNLFKNSFPTLEFADLGNVKNNSAEFVLQLVSELIDGDIIPIILGGDDELLFKLSRYMDNGKISNQATIISNNVNPEYLKLATDQLSYIGYQRHLVNSEIIEKNTSTMANSLSLGELRTRQSIVEPVIRDSSIIQVNLNVIRRSEILKCFQSLPTGLNTEEGCQLMRYAGEALNLKAICFDMSNIDVDYNSQESMIMAEMIWYFLEGVQFKKDDHPSINSDFQEFVIDLEHHNESISFVKNNTTNRWWLKIKEEGFYSCSLEEYEYTVSNDLPERLLQKLF